MSIWALLGAVADSLGSGDESRENTNSGDRFPDVDWWCDRCNAYLNDQSGFDDHKYTWKCTECGHKNSISSDNIYDDNDDFENY